MSERIRVGMADLNICKAPDSILTLGLGSCVGVVLYDRNKKICGMLHAMLPDSTKIRNNEHRAKFVDTGLEDLIGLLEKEGVRRSSLVAKVAGGATMFNFSSGSEISGIGTRNAEAVRTILKQYNIPIIADDTGKNYGRTVEFYPESGKFEIRAVGREVTFI
ncbi:MAG: chemotaxis protein CheD [Lachnospiraceae bacterium]|nr:chemotaxis protein CheD [Lachnospiraceae bacterium]